MKVLITGAAGFIGSQLAYRLWENDTDLILIDNFSYGKYDNLEFPNHSFRNEVLSIDIRHKKDIEKIFKYHSIDYVYNFAGIAPLPDCQMDPCEAIDVNINGFVNILENGRRYGVKSIIQASTNAIYENEISFPTQEKISKYPTLIYPNTKFCAERFAQSYCDIYNMNVTCLRFANVYGPHIDCLRKQPPFIAYIIRELYYNRTPIFYSDGNQRRDYIYIDDLIDLAIIVQRSLGFDCLNVSSNTNYSVNEIYEIVQHLMGKKIVAKYAEDMHYWRMFPELYEGKFTIKETVLNHEINKYTLCDNQYAKEKYNWQPRVSMINGLSILIENECSWLAKRGEYS